MAMLTWQLLSSAATVLADFVMTDDVHLSIETITDTAAAADWKRLPSYLQIKLASC